MQRKFGAFIGLALFVSFTCHAVNKWEPTDAIWNFGIISQCDIGSCEDPFKYFEKEPSFHKSVYQNIKSGDIVWLKCKHVLRFYKKALPSIKHPFVLVISDGDDSFPSDCKEDFDIEDFINNKKIVHIFAQNCDYKGKSQKVSHLPIGIDFHSIAYKGPNGMWGEKGSPKDQEECLKGIISTLKPTNHRKLGAFIDFQISDTTHAGFQRHLQFGEDRAAIFGRLIPTGLIEHGPRMKRSDLWRKKGEYAFSISPHGNGLDCHRTWEDLSLGCIVIVKTSPLDPLYDGLPVVIVNDWSEITKENMERWLEKYGDAFNNPEYRKKLTCAYWQEKIRTAALTHKKR